MHLQFRLRQAPPLSYMCHSDRANNPTRLGTGCPEDVIIQTDPQPQSSPCRICVQKGRDNGPCSMWHSNGVSGYDSSCTIYASSSESLQIILAPVTKGFEGLCVCVFARWRLFLNSKVANKLFYPTHGKHHLFPAMKLNLRSCRFLCRLGCEKYVLPSWWSHLKTLWNPHTTYD